MDNGSDYPGGTTIHVRVAHLTGNGTGNGDSSFVVSKMSTDGFWAVRILTYLTKAQRVRSIGVASSSTSRHPLMSQMAGHRHFLLPIHVVFLDQAKSASPALDPSTSLTFGGATHDHFQCHLTEVLETFLPGTRTSEIKQPAAPFSGSVASKERHCVPNPKAPSEMNIFTIASL